MTEPLGPSGVVDRARAHSRRAQAVVLVLALVVGAYAAWLGGDYGLGLGSLVGFGLVTAYVLLGQPSARAVVSRGLYLLAVLVAATPVFLNLPLATAPHPGLAGPARAFLHPGVLVLGLMFVLLAAVLVGLGYWLDDR